MKRGFWVVAALGCAVAGDFLFGGLDRYLVSEGWFPSGGGGFGGAACAGFFAAALGQGWRRQGIAIVIGAGIGIFGLWGFRYLVGATGLDQANQALFLSHWVWMAAAALMGGWVSRMNPRRATDWGIQLGLVAGGAVVADMLVGGLGIDMAAMNKVLYYQTVELEVHQAVADAELLYGLKPGATLGGEGPWGLRTVRVNSQGARSPEFPIARKDEQERTLVFGGSTLYGAGVSNGDTVPGAMNRMMGPNHEVWNFGVCAYNTAQSAHLAQGLLDTLNPDRVIIMITNTGRRAFMGGPENMGADKSAYFQENPYLYLENFPPSVGTSRGWHGLGLRHSALYRTFAAWARAKENPGTEYADKADQLAVKNLERATAERGIELLYVLSPSRGSEVGPTDFGVSKERWLDLNIPGRNGDYQQAHPPPAILSAYATAIVRWMKRRKAAL
jgi:hypothetical protein